MKISKSLQQKLTDFVGRSPTPHNTQPWELHWSAEGVFVKEDMTRRLPACDPQQRDHYVALGAFIEGIHLILSEEGLGVRDFGKLSIDPMVFELDITPGFTANDLGESITARQSYRGIFAKSTNDDVHALQQLFSNDEALIVTEKSQLQILAKAADKAAEASNKQQSVQAELYQWLRLKDSHPLYQVDGMNREALALPKALASIADVLMRPAVYRKLDQFNLAAALNSEKAQIMSATGMVCLQTSESEAPLQRGRRLYRLWLKLTRAGFYACPHSSLTDDATAAQELASMIHSENTFLCLRVGRIPKVTLPLPARRSLVYFHGGSHEG